MGFFSELFDFFSSLDSTSYIESSIRWGDEVWENTDGVNNAVLFLIMIDERLYKRLRLEFRNSTVGVFFEPNERGWSISSHHLTKQQRQQLKEEGCIMIKRYR